MFSYFFLNIVFFCLKIFVTITNSIVEPNEAQHYAAFHLGLTVCKGTCLEVPEYKGLITLGSYVIFHVNWVLSGILCSPESKAQGELL